MGRKRPLLPSRTTSGCLVGNFSTELADQSRLIRDRLSSNFAAWSRQIEGCIRDGQKAGEISRDIDPRALADFLLNSFEGAILRMKAEKNSSPLDGFMTLVFSAFSPETCSRVRTKASAGEVV